MVVLPIGLQVPRYELSALHAVACFKRVQGLFERESAMSGCGSDEANRPFVHSAGRVVGDQQSSDIACDGGAV